jgi:hypothetical protein
MTHRDSSYYPRRANVLSPILSRTDAWGQTLRKLAWQGPKDVTLFGLAGGLVVPGLAIYLRRPDRSGKAAVVVCAALLLVFVAFLGFSFANAAFTLLLSIHLVGFVAYCKPLFAGMHWPSRLLAGLLFSVAIIVFVYLPLRNLLEHRLFVPLRFHGHVVVVRCRHSPGVIRPGDWIAFRVSRDRNSYNNGSAGHGTVIVAQGDNLGSVLAMAGDHVAFTANSFSVNGIAAPRRPNMPVSGELTVPEKCWFIWSELGIEGHGNVPPAYITDAAMEIATVHQDQFIGKAFKHWFGRRQLFS